MRKLSTKKLNQKDRAAVDELYRTYEWYIIRLANYIARMCKVPVDDLKQEGFIGLVKAHEMYDASKASFLTYAQYWIRVSMFSYAHNFQYPVALPGDFISTHSKYHKMKSADDTRSDDDIFKEIGVTGTRGRKMVKSVESMRTKLSVSDLEPLENYMVYNKLCHSADNSKCICATELLSRIKKVLTEAEFFVIDHLLGLTQASPKTLSWVGKVMNITKERVRQIKNEALSKVKQELGDSYGE